MSTFEKQVPAVGHAAVWGSISFCPKRRHTPLLRLTRTLGVVFTVHEMKLNETPSIFDHWSDDWPSKDYYVSQHDVTPRQLTGLRKLVNEKASETEIERFLKANPQALALVLGLFQTGHHASWIIPKQAIRAKLGSHAPGLIPDYLIAGANSDGVTWWVLELKGCEARAFSSSSSSHSLSPTANRGVVQLLEYIDVCSETQSNLRDQLGLKGFREPRGVLLIGTDDEYTETRRKKLKAAWNRYMPKVQIRSYHALLREVEVKLRSHTN